MDSRHWFDTFCWRQIFDTPVKLLFDGVAMKTQLPQPREILTTSQVCNLLDITRQTLYAWLNQGKVKPWMKVEGASWLFLRKEVAKARDLKYQRY